MASLVWVCRRCSGGVACHDSGRRALRRAHRDRKTTKGNKTLKQNAADRNSGERCRLQPCPDLRSPGACARHATSQEHSGARLHHHHVAGGPLHPVSCAHSASCAHEAWDAAPPTPHGLDGHRDGPAPQETPGGLARAQAAPARANDVRWDCAALASAVRHGGHGGHRGPLPLGSGGAPRGWVHTLGQGRRSSTLEGHDDEGVGRQRGIEAPPRGTPKKKTVAPRLTRLWSGQKRCKPAPFDEGKPNICGTKPAGPGLARPAWEIKSMLRRTDWRRWHRLSC